MPAAAVLLSECLLPSQQVQAVDCHYHHVWGAAVPWEPPRLASKWLLALIASCTIALCIGRASACDQFWAPEKEPRGCTLLGELT